MQIAMSFACDRHKQCAALLWQWTMLPWGIPAWVTHPYHDLYPPALWPSASPERGGRAMLAQRPADAAGPGSEWEGDMGRAAGVLPGTHQRPALHGRLPGSVHHPGHAGLWCHGGRLSAGPVCSRWAGWLLVSVTVELIFCGKEMWNWMDVLTCGAPGVISGIFFWNFPLYSCLQALLKICWCDQLKC